MMILFNLRGIKIGNKSVKALAIYFGCLEI